MILSNEVGCRFFSNFFDRFYNKENIFSIRKIQLEFSLLFFIKKNSKPFQKLLLLKYHINIILFFQDSSQEEK